MAEADDGVNMDCDLTQSELNLSENETPSSEGLTSAIKLRKNPINNEWIQVTSRKKPAGPQPPKKIFSLNLKNQFQALENDIESEHAEPKPPPIFIPTVLKYQTLINTLDKAAKDEYSCKTIGKDQVKVQCTTPTAFRNVVKVLKEENTSFHTYQLKQERKYRVVLRNMHYSADIEDLKQEIEAYGHKVANIFNIKHKIKKTPLSMFYIDLDPADNNKDIYNIKHLQYSAIKIEEPYVKRQIVQCARCQRYGHTKSYCYRQPRCVKCGQNHLSKTCSKEEMTQPTCALCKESHPANYKGCIVYKELQRKKYPPLRPRNHASTTPINQQFIQPGVSYAQITKTDNNTNNTKLEQMMMKLMERMDTMLNLLTTLVSKIK